MLKKYQHVTSNHNTDQSKTQKPNEKIKKNKVLKTKPNSHVTGKRHRSKKKKKKKKKKRPVNSGKKDYLVRHFSHQF